MTERDQNRTPGEQNQKGNQPVDRQQNLQQQDQQRDPAANRPDQSDESRPDA